MKKIEFVYPFELGSMFGGLETKQPERKIVYMAEVTWQDDSEEDSEETLYPIKGALTAYIEDGFLAGDDDKWYFYDIEGNLVKEVAKDELGDCTEIGGFVTGKEEAEINLYIFEKAGNNGGEMIRSHVQANGEKIQLSSLGDSYQIIGFPIGQLIDYNPYDEEDEEDFEDEPECMELSRLKYILSSMKDRTHKDTTEA